MLTIFLLRKANIINGIWLRRLAKTAIYLVFTIVFSVIVYFLFNQAVNFLTSHPFGSDSEIDDKMDRYYTTHTEDNIGLKSYSNLKQLYEYYPHITKTSRKYFLTTTQLGKKEILGTALQHKDIKSLVAICHKEPTNINKDYVFACAYKLGLYSDEDITSEDSLLYYDGSLTKKDRKYVSPQLNKITSKLYGEDDNDNDDGGEVDLKPTAFSKFSNWLNAWLTTSINKGWPDNLTIVTLVSLSSLIFYGLYHLAFLRCDDFSSIY